MEGGINSGLAGRFLIRLASETGRREYAEVIFCDKEWGIRGKFYLLLFIHYSSAVNRKK